MPSSSVRTVAACLLGALVATGAATLPAAASHGPVVIDQHDSHVPARAYDIEWSGNGTLFSADVRGDRGRNYVVNGTMTTGSGLVDLGPGQWTSVRPQMRANVVTIPREPAVFGDPVTRTWMCQLGTCPTMLTFNAPAGTRYIGSAQDRAMVWTASGSNGVVTMLPWSSSSTLPPITFTLEGVTAPPTFAEGDTTGAVVSAGGDVFYLNRATSAVTPLGFGNEARLTPTYAVWWAMGVGDSEPFRTKVWRVARSAPGGAVAETTLPGEPAIETLAASDTGFAYLVPNGDADGTKSLYTAPWDTTPALYARPITTSGLTAFVDPGTGAGRFLVNDRLAGIPGFYSVTPGAASGTLTGLTPVRPANTLAVAASNGRAAYIDDMTSDNPLFLRSLPGATLGPETLLTSNTAGGAVGLSGPFVVFTRPGTTATTTQVVFGRTGGPFTTRTFPISEVGSVGISGRTVYVTHGTRGRLIDVVTSTVTDLGNAYVGVFGRYAVTLDYNTGELRRRDLVTGTSTMIRPAIAGCPSPCIDEERAQLSVWGNEVVYAFQAAAGPPAVAELWSGSTGTSYSLSPLVDVAGQPAWYELKYWAGLLLVSHVGGTVKSYDVRTFAPAGELTIDEDAERPLALDGHVAIWRPNDDLRAYAKDVTELYPGYVASPRYLGAQAPAGFGPGVGDGKWSPTMLVSQDVNWTLEVREGGVAGEIVHSTSGSSMSGEVRPKPWDGTDQRTGGLAAGGTYTWVLTGASAAGGAAPQPLLSADGSATPISGTVYVSAAALPAPALSAPVRSTDVTAGTSFPVTWSLPGAPAGTRYRVTRSANGGAFTTVATTSATSYTTTGTPGTTYRFRVTAVDPAGRSGTPSAIATTVVPHDAGGTFGGTWSTVTGGSYYRGSQRRASAAGATWSFTATGSQIQLVGTKGTSYGRFYVSVDGGAYSAAYDAYSPTTKYRQVLYTKTGLSLGTHTIKVKVAGTSGRPYVGIDGVGYLR